LTYYEKLLDFGSAKILDFLKDIKLYDTQFKYSNFNSKCTDAMYKNNNYDCLNSIIKLKEELPELRQTCVSCKNYYISKRTESVKEFDIKFGQLIENMLIDFLNSKFNLRAKHADIQDCRYPDCQIIDANQNPLAYFEVKYHSAPFIMAEKKIGRICYEGSTTLDLTKVTKQLEIIELELKRPVFYLHWIDYPCLKGIYFETAKQVKNELISQGVAYERKNRLGDFINLDLNMQKIGYTKKFYSKLLEMGTFDELIKIFINIANNIQ